MRDQEKTWDGLIVDLEDKVGMCSSGGNVGGFWCQIFVLGIYFIEPEAKPN